MKPAAINKPANNASSSSILIRFSQFELSGCSWLLRQIHCAKTLFAASNPTTQSNLPDGIGMQIDT